MSKINSLANYETVLHWFEKQAVLTPDNIAIITEKESITYQQLNESANQLGHFLKEKGIKEEGLVPVCLNRSVEMIIAVLGVIKAGGAFVPVDPNYPDEYIRHIIKDTAASVLICDIKTGRDAKAANPEITVVPATFREDVLKKSRVNVHNELTFKNLVYVIYTSGSTGKPKGVMIEHGNLLNYLINCIKYYLDENPEGCGSYLNLPTTFDASITSMFVPLLKGCSVVLAPTEAIDTFTSPLFKKFMPYQFLKMTPGHLHLLKNAVGNDKLNLTKRLILGGEALQYGHIKFLQDEEFPIEVINEYGPTEATVGCCIYSFNTGDNMEYLKQGIPIGKPLDNVALYIVDEDNDLLPIGVTGELCIGGPSGARGYLNQPNLTQEKFIPDQFSKIPGGRLYKTGDKVRRLQDGNIEFIGRVDDQVKVRGYRIELREIESALNKMDMIAACCTVTRKDTMGFDKLVSYYTLHEEDVLRKEKELYAKQLTNWKELYETEYGKTEDTSPVNEEFNIIGWGDSFTGKEIPEDQMAEWLDDIIKTIMKDQPQKVLEIGCGTGLIYYKLSGIINKYFGADLSASSIRQINKRIQSGHRRYSDTELQVNPAHNVSLPAGETVDTVILNSVIQYFPGYDYLTGIIGKSIEFLGGSGRVILGDVRDHRLLKLFKARLSLDKISAGSDIRDFEWMVEQKILGEEELCLSPEYFYGLKSIFQNITHVELQWKEGGFINELTLYRYTVIIYVGINKEKLNPDWIDWDMTSATNIAINGINKLQPIIALKNVPNPRLTKERAINEALNDISVNTVADLLRYCSSNAKKEDLVQDVLTLAKQNGYYFNFLVSPDPLKMNLLISSEPLKYFIEQFEADHHNAEKKHSNVPLFNEINFLAQKEIQDFLKKRLPVHMIPSELISLQKMPLTKNGKIDRKFLSTCQSINKNVVGEFTAPASSLEKSIAEIWQGLLGIERISSKDDFFDMGGHSLLAVRVVSAIRKKLKLEVSLQDFFLYPTISSLAAYLQDLECVQKALLPPILPQPRNSDIPLSFAQERLWFIDKLQGSVQYHIPLIFRLKGNPDLEAIESSFREILKRHEILRTVIKEKEGTGFQVIRSADSWQMDKVTEKVFNAEGKSMHEFIEKLVASPYDLSQDWILKVTSIQVSVAEFIIVAVLHHIAFDGWSVAILSKEFTELYRFFCMQKTSSALPALPIQYADYALWQRAYLHGDVLEKKLAYWKQKLNTVKPLNLPFDYKKSMSAAVKVLGNEISITLENDLKEKLVKLSNKQNCTLFMTMLAAFKVLLYRYTGQNDICVGTPIAGRQQQELENLIGFFVNTLALRNEIDGKLVFSELLQQVRKTTLEAFENQEIPFEKIVEVLDIERDIERNSVFQVLFAMQNTPEIPVLKLGDVILESLETPVVTVRFELNIIVTELKDGINVKISYSSDLFKEDTIRRMLGHYTNILQQVVEDAVMPIGLVNMLSPVEKQQLLINFNNNNVPLPDKTLIQLFEEQVIRTPDNIALDFEHTTITYKDLNEKANRLGHYLQAYGIKDEAVVPICFNRSIQMIVAILGVLKTGAAYMPLDPEYPLDRIQYMLEDVAAPLGLCDAGNLELVEQAGILKKIIELDSAEDVVGKQTADPVISRQNPDNLIYIIYTSGSTGRPKGVMLQHASLVNFILHQSKEFDIQADERILQFYNYCFDPSVEQIFLPLINGAVCVLVSNNVRMDQQQFECYLANKQITHLQATPSFLYNLKAKQYGGLRRVIAGGEVCSIELAQRWNGICDFYNKYGPTETAITATEYFCSDTAVIKEVNSLPIGKPVSNTSIYLVDNMLQLVPIGVAGEINIGGVQVARGYLNQPQLSAEKFVPDIYRNEPGANMYRTGDLARWLPDGNIEYLGRTDDQVKIRGYRVEPGEVESVLQQHPSIIMCAVTGSIDKAGNTRLIAYILTSKDYIKSSVTAFLESKLPYYMVPGIFVTLKSMPVTSTGKVDKKSLPSVDASELIVNDFIAPSTILEIQLAKIWQHILGVGKVGAQDNFFELGGHSLLIIKMVSAIRQELKMEISVRDVFMYPSVRLLADYLQGYDKTVLLPAITRNPSSLIAPLSFSQERLWFIDRLQGSVDYHMPWVFSLEGAVDVSSLELAFRLIVERHEVLRTVIREDDDGNGYQRVLPSSDWKLTFQSSSDPEIASEGIESYLYSQVLVPYDLSSDMMLRVKLISKSSTEHILFVMLHHIAFDGLSVSILVKELKTFYRNYNITGSVPVQLTPPAIQYADYAIWQRNYLKGELLLKKLSYWKDKLFNVSPLSLPADYYRSNVQQVQSAYTELSLSKSLREDLVMLSRSNGCTLFMSLLACFKVLLYRYTGQHDICVGSPVAGRNRQELEELIGFFINTIALRSNVNGQDSFSTFLDQVKSTTLAAYEHQDTPFEKIVEVLGVERDMGRSSIFQVMFSMQEVSDMSSLDLGDVTLKQNQTGLLPSIFDIDLSIVNLPEGLKLGLVYRSDLYSSERMKQLLFHYAQLLQSIISNPSQTIAKLKMLSTEEEHQLLLEFNNTAVDYCRDETFVHLFEKQVKTAPDNIAIIFENKILTYKELNSRSNQLARYLITAGVKQESLVPVFMERGIEMIVGILGILKTGAAYVPIDASYPEERVAYIIDDVKSPIVLTNITNPKSTNENYRKINIADLETDLSLLPTEDLSQKPTEKYLAYIIYTSGTTGEPKGVMISHQSLHNLLLSIHDTYNISEKDRILQFASISFDMSVEEIFPYLSKGAAIVMAREKLLVDSETFFNFCNFNGVTVLNLPPAFWQEISSSDICKSPEFNLGSLRLLSLGGDRVSGDIISTWRTYFSNIVLVNAYGPTEYTVNTTFLNLSLKVAADTGQTKNNAISIGRPIYNTKVYILDGDNNLCPKGVIGELCISGEGLSYGYLNKPALTASKFVENPFCKEGGKMYRSGDLAYWLPDGDIEFIGRTDEQVKIRGHRIELGEIESILNQCPGINQTAIVVADAYSKSKRLIAYVVTDNDIWNKDDVISYLQTKLPDYMIPQLFIPLVQLPVTNNGKLDKQALKAIKIDDYLKSDAYHPPRNEMEIHLVKIWEDLLGVEKIGITDNFFELGGNSIITIQAASRAKKYGYEILVVDFFTCQTIEKISAIISERARIKEQEFELQKGEIDLLPIQRMYLKNQDLEKQIFYSSLLLLVNKELSTEMINDSIRRLFYNNDSLRLNYYRDEYGLWKQKYANQSDEIKVIDLSAAETDLSSVISEQCRQFYLTRDILNGSPVKIMLIKTSSGEKHNRLFIVASLLVMDQVSWHILLKELDEIFSGQINKTEFIPANKSASFFKWHEKLTKYASVRRMQSQQQYWNNIESIYESLLIDGHTPRSDGNVSNGSFMSFLDEENTVKLLTDISNVYFTDVNDILLTALTKELCRWFNKEQLVIGIESSCREHVLGEINISETIGPMLIQYPLLLDYNANMQTVEQIKNTKERIRRLPDRGLGYGFVKLLSNGEKNEKECWDILFRYNGEQDDLFSKYSWIKNADTALSLISANGYLGDNMLMISCFVENGMLCIKWDFRCDQFSEKTIAELANNYTETLKDIISHCIAQKAKGITEFTPADYGLTESVSYQELDKFLNKHSDNPDDVMTF